MSEFWEVKTRLGDYEELEYEPYTYAKILGLAGHTLIKQYDEDGEEFYQIVEYTTTPNQ